MITKKRNKSSVNIKKRALDSSFRDPSGFVFKHKNTLLRQINLTYKKNFAALINSGLYKDLVACKLLVPHTQENIKYKIDDNAYKVIKPLKIPFISYPYEWSFSQLKDAALTTLLIQKKAIKYNMVLKDASAFNIQFFNGKPILIDTLSFEKYKQNTPWVAYLQFCKHFLAPLTLAAYSDIRLIQLYRLFIDGMPLDLTSKLLPKITFLNFSLLSHIHLHSKTQQHFSNKAIKINKKRIKINKQSLRLLTANLESTIKRLNWKIKTTEWGDYYSTTNYKPASFKHKKDIVRNFLIKTQPKLVWDLGANTGEFSRISSRLGVLTISFDIDPLAVEKNYLTVKKEKIKNILPLLVDLKNPSPQIGWNNKERESLIKRGPADTVLALALLHHLAISNNLPFSMIAKFFSKICKYLIIEYVPKADSQVERLLKTRQDIFDKYTQSEFESQFASYFRIIESKRIYESKRTLYLMKRK